MAATIAIGCSAASAVAPLSASVGGDSSWERGCATTDGGGARDINGDRLDVTGSSAAGGNVVARASRTPANSPDASVGSGSMEDATAPSTVNSV
jgi:hypothetical protein